MHCPKCGQNYPDGYQRFCDTDGSRLVPNGAEVHAGVNVFASILTRSELVSQDEVMPELPNDLSAGDRRNSDIERRQDKQMRAFFDQEPEDELRGDIFVIEDEPTPKFFGRRVDPKQIPPGHVDLVERGLLPIILNEFDISDPKNFVGKTVKGRYRVTEMIGEDDTGFAYLAEDRIIGDKRVVVRILTNEDFEDEITGSIYAEERISLTHINHPNVARLFDSGSDSNGNTFLVSEHLDGLTVDEILLIHGEFTSLRSAKIIRQAAYALSDVHNEGILHRDIRPANISVVLLESVETETEIVKVNNFGVASGFPNESNLAYQAPETLDGRIPTVASDIYSLAVVAYEMLTGRIPFDGKSAKELLRQQPTGLEAKPTNIRRELSPEVDHIFEKAFAVDPRARYVTARDFGDAFYSAATATLLVRSIESQPEVAEDAVIVHHAESRVSDQPVPVLLAEKEPEEKAEKLVAEKIAVIPATAANDSEDEPAWTRRSTDPIAEPNSGWLKIAGIAMVGILASGFIGWYYMLSKPAEPEYQAADNSVQNTNVGEPPTSVNTIVPPLRRNIPQPPDTEFFESSKQNLKGDLIRNFVGFMIYYPKDWKVNGSQESRSANTRGKFLDISKATSEGQLKEQMLVSYYPSKGTIDNDAERFPQMLKETNETLKKLLPGYQVVSDGRTNVNKDWPAYEIRFQGSGTSETGERLVVWGRRLFIPAARPGVRNGFEITMLATSYADGVHSVDDVGVRGELAEILRTFEPSQNF